jgi:hypothetical protein
MKDPIGVFPERSKVETRVSTKKMIKLIEYNIIMLSTMNYSYETMVQKLCSDIFFPFLSEYRE